MSVDHTQHDHGAGDRVAAVSNAMVEAIEAAWQVRSSTSPNPWVGATVISADGRRWSGATEPPGGRHAEIVAMDAARAAGAPLHGATMVVTLEPCAHHGRTPPCTDALLAAGIGRVVYAVGDPDPQVAGKGEQALRAGGVDVQRDPTALPVVEAQLAPYLHHRRTGRPYVVLKLAATVDGGTAAPDGSSQWITGVEARTDAHALRAASDAVLVGAGTVRADDPSLTVRLVPTVRQPMRVVLGTAPAGAKVQPCLELRGPLGEVLDELGRRGVLQLMVEGGPRVAGAFHRDGLVQRYVLYLAPALFGGTGARGLFEGNAASTMAALWRGRIVSVRQLGEDLRVEIEPAAAGDEGKQR
ncbi:MAG: bifunctional diaminohydroxyphosphoribosylaminopyrimidine deaminase/5-amino-6-(5-phosphoribosylamino)uracil reductase RibD [Acidimicrobiales bacterium]